MLSVEEKTACLKRGIFEALDEETLAAMASRMGEREAEDGEVLFMRGEPGDEIFVIVEGGVEIFVGGHVIALLGPGQLFGEMAVLGGGTRTAGGRAKGRTRLLFLKGKAIKLLVQQIPDLAFAIFSILIERLDEANRLAQFLAGEKHELGRVRIESGDLAGRSFPIFHAQAILGRCKGTVAADALRLALPSASPALLERHALVRIDGESVYIEPLDGEVMVYDAGIEDSMEVTPDDPVEIGGMTMHFEPVKT